MRDFIEVIDMIKVAEAELGSPTVIWYRGQSSVEHGLLPSLFRFSNGVEKEQILYERYKQSTAVSKESPSEWEILFNMQHYAVPTRLLDWTDTLGVAMFFLTRGSMNEDSALWILDPTKLNSKGVVGEKVPFVPSADFAFSYYKNYLKEESANDLPIAVHANYTNARILAQKGCFTIHGKILSL